MRGSRLRHNIVGSEVGNPRPMAYMRRGRTRRASARRRPWGRLLALAAALFLLAALWLVS